MSREVNRYRSRRLRYGQLDPREITEALAYAAQQQADLAVIVERLERLQHLDKAPPRGGAIEGSPPSPDTDAIDRAIAGAPQDTAFVDAAASGLAGTDDGM